MRLKREQWRRCFGYRSWFNFHWGIKVKGTTDADYNMLTLGHLQEKDRFLQEEDHLRILRHPNKASTFAAQMKSFSESLPMAWVV